MLRRNVLPSGKHEAAVNLGEKVKAQTEAADADRIPQIHGYRIKRQTVA